MTPATSTTDRRRRIRRTLSVLALTTVFTLLAGGVASAQLVNPFDGVTPDLSLLGPALNTTWKQVLAAVWGGCFALAGLYLLTSFLKLRKARNRGMSNDLSESGSDVKEAIYILAGISSVAPIVGGVLLVFQPAA